MAYVLLQDRLIESVRIQQQAALLAAALGGDVEIPDLGEELAAFDARLAERAPQQVVLVGEDLEREELLRDLGLPNRLTA